MKESTITAIVIVFIVIVLLALAALAGYQTQISSRIENTCKPTSLYTLKNHRVYDCSSVGMKDLQ